MKKRKLTRVIRGIILAPLCIPVAFALYGAFLSTEFRWGYQDIIQLLGIIAFVAYPIMLLFGFPYAKLLEKFNCLNSFSIISGGFSIAVFLYSAFVFFTDINLKWESLLFMGALGFSHAAIFLLIACPKVDD